MNPPPFLRAQPSSFSFLQPPPNPNPNPNRNPSFFNSQSSTSNINNTNPITSPPLLPPSCHDLPTALSTLKDLIRLSEATLDSLSTLSLSLHTTDDEFFCSCPFNSHHRVHPKFLFLHSLHCSSPPGRSVDIELLSLESLRYPHTLQSSEVLIKHNRFLQTLHDPRVELCFSLDEYFDFAPNFFYLDCPGVVSSNDQDTTGRTFTLPGILAIECANFISSRSNEIKVFPVECLRLLPSELWLVRSEIEAWNDYPSSYSYSVLRSVLCSGMADECEFLRWVIDNSSRYGVVIDMSMGSHLSLLFRLCLKAIVNEACLMFPRDVEELKPVAMNFKCPILVEVLTWLSCQFSVLFGAVKGKLFVLDMHKQWILNVLLHSSLFLMVEKAPKLPSLKDVTGKSVQPLGKSLDKYGNGVLDESISGKVIFVSQVAAAVAALHERSFLEEKIKAIQDAQGLARYQRMAEHAHLTKRAVEVRQNRSNYRPLLEHDGLFWQQPRNQEFNKTKTREELLAEERDYKRRRMAYRGKKLKRTPIQVMRNIIEEHMEIITQAGGIGCLVKGSEQAENFSSKPSLSRDISSDIEGLMKTELNQFVESRERTSRYKQSRSHNNVRSTRFGGELIEDRERCKRVSSWHLDRLEGQSSFVRDRHDRVYHPKSPNRKRSNDHLRDHISDRRYNNDMEQSRKNISRSLDSSKSRPREQSNHRKEQVDRNSEMIDRRHKCVCRDRESQSTMLHEFEDRYDPSESCEVYDDDTSFCI